MSRRSVILKIAGLDPKKDRKFICDHKHECGITNCNHGRPHKEDEECMEDWCGDCGDDFPGVKTMCVPLNKEVIS